MHNPRVRPLSSLLYTCITFPPQSAAFGRGRPPTRSRNHYKGLQLICREIGDHAASEGTYVKHFWGPDWFVPLLYWYAASWLCLVWIASLAVIWLLLIFCCKHKPPTPPPPFHGRYFALNLTYMQYNNQRGERRAWCRFSDPLEPRVEAISGSLLAKQKAQANK